MVVGSLKSDRVGVKRIMHHGQLVVARLLLMGLDRLDQDAVEEVG